MKKELTVTILLLFVFFSCELLNRSSDDPDSGETPEPSETPVVIESPAPSATAEPENPVPGNNGILIVSDITTSSLKLTWAKASDFQDSQALLSYSVYYSLTDDLTNLSDITNNGTLVQELSDSDTLVIDILNSDTLYYFNIIVHDSEDNPGIYTSVSAKTLVQTPDYYKAANDFYGGMYTGQYDYNGLFNGRPCYLRLDAFSGHDVQIQWTGSQWLIDVIDSFDDYSHPSDSYLPPQTGWYRRSGSLDGSFKLTPGFN